MAKKNFRSRRSPSPQRTAPATVSAAAGIRLDPAEQYRYVQNDLRRVGLLAAIFIGGLVALSFVLK
jgi:hypothetical protein